MRIEGNAELIYEDPRLTKAQLAAIKKAAAVDEDAVIVGLDAKMRPVVEARLSGPGRRAWYALMRNGDPAKPSKPLAEEWA